MKKSFILLTALVSGILSAQQKDSINTNLDEVIVNGKYYKKYLDKTVSNSLRLDENILEIPQNVTIITNRALEDQQILSISDGVLRNVSGATRQEHWGDLYTNVVMRGSRAAALLNGVNVSSTWGPLSEDMSYVDHIEFVKGPAGFLMSNGEPSGMYNIVTKKATGNPTNGSLRLTSGSFDLYRAEADADVKINDKLAIRVDLMGQNKRSFRQYEFNDRYIASTSLRYELDKNTVLTAGYRYQKARMSDVGSAYAFTYKGYKDLDRKFTTTDPSLPKTNIDEHTTELNLQHKLSENWKLTAQLTYMTDHTMGGDTWPSTFSENGLMKRRYNYWEAVNDQVFSQLFINGNVKTGNIGHKILVGLDNAKKKYSADWSQGFDMDVNGHFFDIYNPTPMNGTIIPFDKSIPLSKRASIIQSSYFGIYAQDELYFFKDKLRLTLAARYTNAINNNYGTESKAEKVTPRFGLSYSISNNLSVYGLFDQTFLPQSGIMRSGNEIKPITGNNLEFGVKKEWAEGKWLSTVSVYRIIKDNELTADPLNNASESYSIVLGKKRAQGIEFDLKGEIIKGLNAIVNYAFTENLIIDSNDPTNYPEKARVPGYAKHTANAWLDYTFSNGVLKGLGFSFGGTYLGDRGYGGWVGYTVDQSKQAMGDYVKFDAGAHWEYNKFRVNLNVFNVFDRYLYSGSVYGNYYYYQAEAPRNWRLSIGYSF